jgi:hypothetical protein
MALRYSVTFIYIQVERKNLTEIISYILCSSLTVSLTLLDNLFRWIKHILFPNTVHDWVGLRLWCLAQISTIFQLYRVSRFH